MSIVREIKQYGMGVRQGTITEGFSKEFLQCWEWTVGEQECMQARWLIYRLLWECKLAVKGLGKSGSSKDGKEQKALRLISIDTLLKIKGEIKLPTKEHREKKLRTKTGNTKVKKTIVTGKEPRNKTMRYKETWENVVS